MSKVLCEKSDLVAIADSVREKIGTSDTFYVSELSGKIKEISDGGSSTETWVLNDSGEGFYNFSFSANFTSNGQDFTLLRSVPAQGVTRLFFGTTFVGTYVIGTKKVTWTLANYRKLVFSDAPTGNLLTWLQTNGVKQEDNLAIESSKALEITSNGITFVTPDAPYDALKKVDVTVNVVSGGGGETTRLQVNVSGTDIEGSLFCLWQTSDGWMGTSNFDTATAFTIPNVIVGGYVIFTHDPGMEYYFSSNKTDGVEDLGIGAMDAEWDLPNAALVMKVTAPSPSFTIRLLN